MMPKLLILQPCFGVEFKAIPSSLGLTDAEGDELLDKSNQASTDLIYKARACLEHAMYTLNNCIIGGHA